MREVYRRYFKVTEGLLVEAVQEAMAINAVARKEYSKILKEVGANPGFYHRGNRLVGMEFDEEPDKGVYKRVKNAGWYPKKNSSAGKELAARLEFIETRDIQECLRAVGLSPHPSIFADGKCYWPVLTVIPDTPPVVFVGVPWFDEDPEELANYEEDRVAIRRFDSSLDSLLWVPDPELVEVKRWERDRHIDEWNEKVRARDSVEPE